MSLTEKGYKPRLVDSKIQKYLSLFGALSIEGPKWCGKTWSALCHANSVVYILDPENGYANREAARFNPASILAGKKPLLVDEWQEVPAIWDAVRFAADRSTEKGLFLLTGSVTPKENTYSHSGAGRIARIRMRPMTLFESGVSNGVVSLSALFKGGKPDSSKSALTQKTLIDALIRGGWPGNLATSTEDAGILPVQYIHALAETDISSPDNIKRNPDLVLHLLASLARVNATIALNSAICADVQARFGAISRQSVSSYLSALTRLYVLDEIPQWFPSLRTKIRLRKSPKRILTDPSIAVAALGAKENDLMRDMRTLGLLFENLCLRDLLVYADSIGAKLSHYHDDSGLEVDAILELGTMWAAIEIKIGAHLVDAGIKTLKRLASKITERGAPAPAFLMILTGGGPSYTNEDGIHIVPIDLLRE